MTKYDLLREISFSNREMSIQSPFGLRESLGERLVSEGYQCLNTKEWNGLSYTFMKREHYTVENQERYNEYIWLLRDEIPGLALQELYPYWNVWEKITEEMRALEGNHNAIGCWIAKELRRTRAFLDLYPPVFRKNSPEKKHLDALIYEVSRWLDDPIDDHPFWHPRPWDRLSGVERDLVNELNSYSRHPRRG